ncbi:LEAF RUST 10 DISEASE-RESISTANCE LOCUS RECEPTOR-LIKE PROTEIN KINASE-like 1.2 isoform X2 [Ananas comosus]|uniref:non-specific serine/threonine protein kinase n=1 Tax=Ananas comosus TaxID=4615 RepID=A0A6P5F2Y6_ANACO|nr:LEAF RUST 10 DISEASE-RESISTANCE LOCUS RECEPTOR-LIKE PROTEIN KINASE-like 1.2 isoform X2 [Ananas comosus]
MKLFLLIAILSSSPIPSLSVSPRIGDCQPASCGNVTRISYPFRVGGRQPSYCGHPAFELVCGGDGVPALKSSYDGYYFVRSIFYHNSSVWLGNSNWLHGKCPLPLFNLTFGLSPLAISAVNAKLFFFYACSGISPAANYYYRVPCANDTSVYLGGFDAGLEGLNPSRECEAAVVPVVGIEGVNASGYEKLLRNGVIAEWTVADCSQCEASNGQCGYDGSAFMCICPDRPHLRSCKKSNLGKKIGIGIGAGAGGILVISFVCLLVYKQKKRKRTPSSSLQLKQTNSSRQILDLELNTAQYRTHIFSYEELEEATDGFNASKELGDGGFGRVYEGKLRDGRTVAVKRLYENSYKRVEQFMNEVDILSRLRHQSLVTLYGCTSSNSRELLLVYEYVSNGTVADHLHGSRAGERALTWSLRLNIAIEAADALAYLHAVEPQIIHRDVKTTNILLDNSFHVKVGDFGMSRLFPLDVTHVSTAPQGTPGYVDPEYYQCYQLTDKSDVYSFGVVLVELISSKPAVDINRSRYEVNLASFAISKIQSNELDQLVDPEIGHHSDSEMKKMIAQVAELAFRCLRLERDMRPPMKEVLEVLRGIRDGANNVENVGKGALAQEDAYLLRKNPPYSPDSVTDRWMSKSTTPNNSA